MKKYLDFLTFMSFHKLRKNVTTQNVLFHVFLYKSLREIDSMGYFAGFETESTRFEMSRQTHIFSTLVKSTNPNGFRPNGTQYISRKIQVRFLSYYTCNVIV